jgi:Resolvase, N terminal domain
MKCPALRGSPPFYSGEMRLGPEENARGERHRAPCPASATDCYPVIAHLRSTLVDIIVDAGIAAKTLQREGLQQALSLLTSGHADGIIVVKLDRLTRNVADLGTLITDAAKLIFFLQGYERRISNVYGFDRSAVSSGVLYASRPGCGPTSSRQRRNPASQACASAPLDWPVGS